MGGGGAAVVLGRLGDLFGQRAAEPKRLVVRDWASEPWSRGRYAGYFGPGGWTDFGGVLRRPVDRLHWAGTETATTAQATMDGAVRAGERAADEVAARLSVHRPSPTTQERSHVTAA